MHTFVTRAEQKCPLSTEKYQQQEKNNNQQMQIKCFVVLPWAYMDHSKKNVVILTLTEL